MFVPVTEPPQQGNWVTVSHSRGSKHRSSVPIKTSNRFSPLIDAPTEKPDESALVIGVERENRDTSHHSPMSRGDEIHSRLSSLNGWMSKWCPQNNIGFIDK